MRGSIRGGDLIDLTIALRRRRGVITPGDAPPRVSQRRGSTELESLPKPDDQIFDLAA
jgi:hypothetical protein